MKMVYTHENHFMVNNIKNLIDAQSINTFLKNEFAQGVVGEVSAFDAWPEVWVFNDNDYSKALAIVNSAYTHNNSSEWTCRHCDEKNDISFEICWNCQAEHGE